MLSIRERIIVMTTAHKKKISSKRISPKQLARVKRRRRARFIRNVMFAGLFIGIFVIYGKDFLRLALAAESPLAKPVITITDYTEKYRADQSSAPTIQSASLEIPVVNIDSMDVEAPLPDSQRILNDEEAEARLAALAAQDPDIAEIYAHRTDYPEQLLMALSVNAEMKDFVKGYLTSDFQVKGGISDEEAAQSFPLFLQWDSRWGYVPYGGMNIGVSGCGPTCLSMVIYALTRDVSATPDALSAYAMNNGYYMEGTGTAWALMTDAPSLYGLRASELGLDEAEMKYCLDRGYPIICSMRPGDFTLTGHFIVLYGYDEEGFLVNDPNSRERSSRHWDFNTLHYQIKNLWYYSKA